MASPRVSKAPSITSSAGTNKSTSLPFLPRYTPKPEPAYISPAAAADYVLHSRNDDQLDQISPSASPTNESAVFSERSLSLLNTFLDSLLYNFLAKARGTSLSQLKPAITEVLKAKLARDALASADEELEGLVSEADLKDQEDVTTFGGREGWSQEWHLEMAFKRMRLRVMVFIRLGDFDDEDEERFLDEEDDLRNGEKVEQEDMLASPAAVYLAGVLEYIAERALQIVGDVAWKRAAGKAHRRLPSDQSELSDIRELVIQDGDVEKITLNPTLGRLWRTWRKNYRVMSAGTAGAAGLLATVPPSPPFDSFRGRLGSLNEIATTTLAEEKANRHLSADEIPEGDVLESDIAANIPLPINANDIEEIDTIETPDQEAVAAIALPIGDNDINEIEVPGLAKEIIDNEEEEVANEQSQQPRRPISVILSWLTPFSWAPEKQERPKLQRLRSNSMPMRDRPKFLDEEVFTPLSEHSEPTLQSEDGDDISSNMEEGIVGIPDIDNITPEEGEDANAGKELEVESASLLRDQIDSAAPNEAQSDRIPANAKRNLPTTANTPESVSVLTQQEKMEVPVAKIADTLPSSREGGSFKPGYVASAAVGAAALVSTAAVSITGASKDASPGEALVSVDATKEDEKPKSLQSNSIADRRRMFEAQAKAAAIADSEEVPLVSPAAVEKGRSPIAQEPRVRGSSLKNNPAIAAIAVTTVPAATPIEEVSRTPTDLAINRVDPRVDREVAEGTQAVHDERAIGVARTSDVPVPYPKTSQAVSPSPIERQRSYHLPGNQSPQAFQGRNEHTHSDRNASQDRSLVGADDCLLPREQSSLKQASMRSVPKQETQQNGNFRSIPNAPQNVTFYHSDEEREKNEQSSMRSPTLTSKPRPPPLMMASPEPAESPIRPTSGPRSASSTPGGHSNKGSFSSSTVQRHLDKKSLEESRQRDFDSLLKNNEPIKYTLTPDDLRTTTTTTIARSPALADRGPPSPRIISSPGVYATKRSPPRENNALHKENSSATTNLAGGRKVGVPRVSEYKRAAANKLSSRPEEMNTGAVRSGFMPREPRVLTDNTSDLADYMASTAPIREQTVLPLARAAAASRPDDSRTSSPLPRSSPRQRLVPREPDVKKDGTSELIDFIRQGPPGSKSEREQRRTVAPFRTTMDSDDFNKLGDFTSSVDKSFGSAKRDSSFNSGLLGNSSSTRSGSVLVAPGGPQVVKKQRRVKDPYAIDSDDGEDYLTSLPAAGKAVQQPKEESLADFLRNSEPPSGSNEPKALGGGSAKTSSLMGRSGSHIIAASGKASNTKSSMINSGFSFPSISKMKVEARAAGATRNGFGGNGFHYSTNDMADFLKSSGPVENMAPTQQPQLQKKPSKRSVGSKRSIGSRSLSWLRGDR